MVYRRKTSLSQGNRSQQPEAGITELRYIDPLKIKKVREIRKNDKDPNAARRANGGQEPSALDYDFGNHDEYYIYNPKGFLNMNGPEQKVSALRWMLLLTPIQVYRISIKRLHSRSCIKRSSL